MDEIISYKMCAVKVRNAKLRNYLNKSRTQDVNSSNEAIKNQQPTILSA